MQQPSSRRWPAIVLAGAAILFSALAQASTHPFPSSPPAQPIELGPGEQATVTLLEEARGKVRLRWEFSAAGLEVSAGPAGRSVRARGFGLRPGGEGVDLPFRIERVAIPAGATPRLVVTRSQPAKLLPLESLPVRTESGGRPAPRQAQHEEWRSPVELGATGRFRDQRFAELRIRPLRLMPDGATLEVHESYEAEVFWDLQAAQAEPPADPLLESIYSMLFVNAGQGRAFRSRRPGEDVSSAITTTASQAEAVESVSLAAQAAVVPATGPSLRIEVARAGVVRVTQAQIAAAAPDIAALDACTLRLTCRGAELPMFVAGESNCRLDSGEYVEFYAITPPDAPVRLVATPPASAIPIWQLSDFTDTNVYWLDSAAGTRLRTVTLSANPTSSFPLAADWGSLARFDPPGFFRTYGGNDPWAACPRLQDRSCGGASCCQFPDADFSVALPGFTALPGAASVKVILQGYTNTPHRAEVRLNGLLLDATPIEWSSLGAVERIWPLSNSSLAATNTINVELPGNGTGSLDSVLLDRIEIGYRRRFTASGGELIFSSPDASQTVEVDGFTSQPVVWYDVSQTDPATGHPLSRRLSGATVTPITGGFRTRFELVSEGSDAPRQVVIASQEAVRTPLALRRVQQASLRDPANGADLILISHPDLFSDLANPAPGSALQEYIQHRQSQGLRVKRVNVLEIFDQFSGGLPETGAIRDFLAAAYTGWTAPPPAAVLFLGDGTSDYKNIKTSAAYYNQIPAAVHSIEDPFFGSYSADTWYANFLGDGATPDFVPDILFGRISAGGFDEAERVLRKILRYETAPAAGDWRQRGLFVVGDGKNDTQDVEFPALSDRAAAWFAPPFSAVKLYYSLSPYDGNSPSQFHTVLMGQLNEGAAVVNYVGHGNFSVWDDDIIFKREDVADLTNTDRLPVVFNSTCLMGGFQVDTIEALGEVFMESTPDTGAIAVFAPSGLSFLNIDQQVTDALYSALMGPQRLRTLGEVVMAPRVVLGQQGSVTDLENLTLLGDPLLRMDLPAPTPPSGLSAAAGSLRVDLTWVSSPDSVAGYHVYRTQASNPDPRSGAVYTRLTASPAAATAFADTTVKNTQTYYYAVTAIDTSGFESPFSNFNSTCGVSATDCVRATPFNPNPPAAPRGLTATDPAVGFRIDLTWLPNSEADLKTYTVHWGPSPRTSPGVYPQRRDVGLVTRASIESLDNNVRYYFAVTATNTSDGFIPPGSTTPLDTESAFSNEASAVPTLIQGIRPPAMIRDLRIERDPTDPASIRLSWTKPLVDIYGGPISVAGFQVHRSEAIDFKPTTATLRTSPPLGPDVTSWQDPGAYTDTRSFYYLVLAFDPQGRLSAASHAFPTGINDLRIVEERNTTTGAPTGFLVLSWGAVSRDIEGQPTVVDHYEIYGANASFRRDQIGSVPRIGSVAGITLRVATPPDRFFFYSVIPADRRGNLSPF